MKKRVTHFEEIQIDKSSAKQRWSECYMANFKDYGYESIEGYVQATIDYLRINGYTIDKGEIDVDRK